MAFDEKFIEELKQKNDIVDVVGKYCVLKKRGSVNHWACCPLPGHSEKTPSFTVNEPGQFFKCFGCGRGGDVITFIMTMENLDYVGAIKYLADRAGIPMPEDNRDFGQIKKDKSDRERLLALMKDTALFYVHNLKKPQAAKYLDYMQARGIDKKTVTTFGIGASLDLFSLPEYLSSKGYTEDEMIRCCVCKRKTKDNGKSFVYDFFAERLIFPIINNLGNVIGFGGRVLEKKPQFMKYKNTEETELFKKSRTLYNINNLKKEKALHDLSEVILVEGYMGTITPYMNGFKNIVASMGTSLTVEQAKILKRYTNTVVISYDGDSAGQNSTLRGLEILSAEGLEVKVVMLPEGLDPDDFVRKYGGDAYKKLIDNSIPLIDFKLMTLSKKYDLNDVSERRKYIKEAVKLIAELKSESVKEDLLRKLSDRTRTTYESLKRDADKSSAADSKIEDVPEEVAETVKDGVKNAERFILCSKLFNKQYARNFDLYSVSMRDPVHVRLCDIISEYAESGKDIFPSAMSSLFSDEDLAEYDLVLSAGDNVFGTPKEEKYFEDCINLLKKDKLEQELKELNAVFTNETDVDKRKQIVKMIADLTAKLSRY